MRRTIPHDEQARPETWLLEPRCGSSPSERSSAATLPRPAGKWSLPSFAQLAGAHESDLIEFSSGSVESERVDPPGEQPPADPSAPAAREPRPAASDAPAGLRFLLVEDDADSRVALSDLLSLHGHAVEAVGTGGAAIAAAQRAAFDAVLVDVGLPDVDGYEVGRRMLERADGPIVRVALTGHDGPEAREQSRAAGFHLHLVKPVDLSRLLAAVGAEFRARRPGNPPLEEGCDGSRP